MKITGNALDEEDLEEQEFEKITSKRHLLKGKQSVKQLLAGAENPADPFAKFEHPDLNILCKLGYIDGLIAGIKTGKEASVFLGRNSDGFIAVKIYTDLRVRSFKRDAAYRQGRYLGDKRLEKAIGQGTQKGIDSHQRLWVQEESVQMQHLYLHGVKVPKVIAVSGMVLVMEFIGDESGTPAPRISDLHMAKEEAEEAFRQSVQNLRSIIESGRVHGDYSTFNILWQDGRAVVIDFPQVIEFKRNPQAHAFLERDVRSLCSSFMKQGVKPNEAELLREIRKKAGRF